MPEGNNSSSYHSLCKAIPAGIAACVVIFYLIGHLRCSESAAIPDQSIVRDWFVNTSTTPFSQLLHVPSSKIDSIIKDMKIYGSVQSKKGAVQLPDTNGIMFTAGFQTPSFIHHDSTYPLIVYLHGGTSTQVNTKGEKAFEMLSPLADSTALFLVSPSASRDAPWWSPAGVSRIMQTLRFMTLNYPIDTLRVFLVGVSDGATGCFAVANAVPRPFAGFITISGYGGMLPSAGIELFPENLRQRPFYNVNATEDHLYSIDIVNKFLDFLENSGVRITRKIYTGEKHGFDYREREYPQLAAIITSWRRETFIGNTWRFVPDFPNTPAGCINWKLRSGTQRASISTYPSGDTLIVQCQGIERCVLHLPDQFRNKPVKLNSGKVTIPSQKTTLRQYNLDYMKYSCFPEPVSGFFLAIQ